MFHHLYNYGPPPFEQDADDHGLQPILKLDATKHTQDHHDPFGLSAPSPHGHPTDNNNNNNHNNQHTTQPVSSASSLSGTLPTFTFVSHHPNAQSNTQNHLPSHLHLPVQHALRQPHTNQLAHTTFIHHGLDEPGDRNDHDAAGLSERSPSLAHSFGQFSSIDPSHHILANFTHSYGVSGVYNPVDITHIVNSPVLTVPDLPATLPPLNTAAPPLDSSRDAPDTVDDGPEPKRQKPSPKISRERAPWTPEEDNLLRLAVQLYGDKTEKWAKIAACVPGRTNKNCRKRWFHSLDPSLRKGAWTDEEDQLLREGVIKYPNQWSKIADTLEGRTDDQCAKRWRESLDPAIDRSEWTEAEDKRLMEKYEEFGSRWQKIAQFFDGRPGLHCRNRWRKLQRMIQMKKEKEMAATALGPNAFVNGFSDELRHAPRPPMDTTSSSSSSDTSSAGSTATGSSLHSNHGPTLSPLPRHDAQQELDPAELHSDLNPYGCDIPGCYASFPQSSGLFYHMKSAHPNLEGVDKPYRCAMPSCSKRYKNINGLQYHLREAKGSSGHGLFAVRPRSNNPPHPSQQQLQQVASHT